MKQVQSQMGSVADAIDHMAGRAANAFGTILKYTAIGGALGLGAVGAAVGVIGFKFDNT